MEPFGGRWSVQIREHHGPTQYSRSLPSKVSGRGSFVASGSRGSPSVEIRWLPSRSLYSCRNSRVARSRVHLPCRNCLKVDRSVAGLRVNLR